MAIRNNIPIPGYLDQFVRTRSHAIAEEIPCYEDEGVAREDMLTQADILDMVLDSLNEIARAEYDVLVRVWGEVASKAALLTLCVDP